MIRFIIFALCLCAAESVAQQAYGPTNDSLYLGFYRDSIGMLKRPTIVIVPFQPKYYRSEIDRDIAKGTTYTFDHTRGFFRKGLDNAILIAAKEYNDYQSMHADEQEVNADLYYLYQMTGVSNVPYEAPVVTKDKEFKKHLADYWVKLQTNVAPAPEPGTRIKEGQIHSVADTRELIAKTRIFNPAFFDSLGNKYHADYFLFVNEYDMLYAANSQTELESDNFSRVIIVHYTVYDAQGNELFSLLKKRYFSSYENDLPTIIQEELLPIGYEVVYSLDSYRFLQAGLKPLSEAEVELAKNRKEMKFAPLQKFK